MAEEYLSTDPNAGVEDQYLSTDPNAGLEPSKEGGVGAGVLSAVGNFLNPINLVKGALGLGQPSDISQIVRYGKTLGEIVTGTSPDEAIGQNIPELQHEREAFYGKLGTKEQAAQITGMGLQAALLAAPFIHGKVLPRAPGTLSEVAGLKPVEAAPEAMPQTPETPITNVAEQTIKPEPIVGGEINAEQVQGPTRADVNVQLPGGAQAREGYGGEMPTNVGGEGVPTRGQGEALQQAQEVAKPSISELLNRYDEGDPKIQTVRDLVDELDAQHGDNPEVAAAIEKYRSDQEENMQEFGGRGDEDQIESEFLSAVEKAKSEAAPVPQPEQPTSFKVTFGKDVFGQSETPVSAYVMESGGLLSKSGARKAGKFEGNEALWNDTPSLKHPTHNKVYKATGEMPDVMAQNLYDNGLIGEPTTGAMYRAIEGESKTSREAVRNAQPIDKIKQAESFGKEQRKEQQSGAQPIPASDLNVGDSVSVGGEELRVKDVNPDDFSVTLEDGRQFGVQEVAGEDVIYGQHKTTAPRTEEFAPVSGVAESATVEPQPKTELPPVEPPKGTGVSSERFTEQYGEDAPVPNTGRSASELKQVGQTRLDNFQKTGDIKDDPYSVLTNLREGKVPVSQLADDVSLLRAEHQRLKNDAISSEGTPEWEAKSQASLDMAKAIKEVAHGPASDMMRSFQEYDAPRYDNVTDFDQALRERLGRESTSQERVKFKEMADDVTNTRNSAQEEIGKVQKKLSKMPKMKFEDAAQSIHDQIAELTKDCVL